MPTIKIKVKYLLLIIVLIPLLLFALPYGYLFYADRISDIRPQAAVSMYKKYIDSPAFIPHRDRAMFSLALKSFYVKGGSYYEKLSTDGSSINSSYISKEMLDTTITLYKNLLKNYKDSSVYEKSYNNLLYIYTYCAKVKEGEKLIAEGELSDKKPIRLIAEKYNLYYKIAAKQYSSAINFGVEVLKEFSIDSDLYKLIADACLLNKDFDKAIYYYNKAADCINNNNYNYRTTYYLFQSGNYTQQASLVKALKANSNKNNLVSGRITVLGKGVPFARVYLKKLKDNGMYTGDEIDPNFGITDFNGNYLIKGAPRGSYKLMLVIQGFLLNDTVLSENSTSNVTLNTANRITYDFNFVKPLKLRTEHTLKAYNGNVELSWEPVERAAYYIIHAVMFSNPLKPDGNSAWTQISGEITGNSCRLDLNAVNIKSTGFSVADNGAVNPQAYLGTFYPGCAVPIFVNAYDKNGLLLTSSMQKVVLYDTLPIITLNKENLLEGESLILEGKPEEAKKVLQAELKASPYNIRLMNILSNLYTKGTRIYYNKSTKKVIGQDLSHALALNTRLYKLTENPEYIRKNNYIYQYELKDYKGLLKSFENLSTSKLIREDYYTLGDAYLILGKFHEARECFDKMYKIIKFTPVTDLNPTLLDLYNMDFKDALTTLEKSSKRLFNVSSIQLNTNIKALEDFPPPAAEYEAFKKILRMLLMHTLDSTSSEKYKEFTGQINNPHLTDLINQALNYHNIY